jgi:hypothetical protein
MAVEGTYSVEWISMQGKSPGTIPLKQDGNSLGGSMSSDQGTAEFEGGTVTGDEFECSVPMNAPQVGEIKMDVKGTVSGDGISGEAQFGGYGSATFKGTRA